VTKAVDLAYIAGVIDSEGYVGIKKTKPYKCQGRVTFSYHARIQIRMVDEPAIRFIARKLGGWYYPEKPHANKGRPLFCWQASDRSALNIVRTVKPHLKVKAKQAEILLQLGRIKAKRRRVMVPTEQLSRWGTPMVSRRARVHPDDLLAMDRLWHQARLLNGLARFQ